MMSWVLRPRSFAQVRSWRNPASSAYWPLTGSNCAQLAPMLTQGKPACAARRT